MYWLFMFIAYVMPVALIGLPFLLFFAGDRANDAIPHIKDPESSERIRSFVIVFLWFLNWMAFGFFCDYVHGSAMGTTPESNAFFVASSTSTAPVSETVWVINLIWGGITWRSLPVVAVAFLIREFTEEGRLILPVAGGGLLVLWTLATIANFARSVVAYTQ